MSCCPGADSTIADCDSILSDTIVWDADNDLVDQRNALIEFYNATGGEYWTSYVLTSSLRSTISGFDAYLVELGELTSASGFDISHLSTEYQEVIAAADALSVNCTVQRTLQLINLLVKYPWNTASECPQTWLFSFSALATALICCVCISACCALITHPGPLTVTRHSCNFASRQQCSASLEVVFLVVMFHKGPASRSYPFLSDTMASLDACLQACYHSPTYLSVLLITDVSYCQWSGVACCETAGDFFSQYCSQGSQSVAQIFLTGKTLK